MLARFVVEVGAEGIAACTRIHISTFLVEETDRHKHLGFLRAATDRHVVFLLDTRTEHHLHPVGIRQFACARCTQQLKGIARTPCVTGTNPVLGTEELDIRIDIAPTHTGIHVHLCALGATFLGSDKNDTTRSLRTVDSRRSCIFQHLDRLHIAHIEVKARVLCHTVHHVERSHTVERPRTANHNLGCLTRRTATLGNRYTRSQTLQRLGKRLGGEIGNLFGRHRRDTARYVAALLRTVTNHHHIVQHLHIFLQRNVVNRLIGSYLDILRLIADIRHHHLLTCGNVQRVVSVEVGNRTVACTGFGYTGTDNRLAFRVRYHAFYWHCLQRHRRSQTCHTQKYSMKDVLHTCIYIRCVNK